MDKHLGSKYEVDGISGVKDSFKQLWEKIKQKEIALEDFAPPLVQ